MIIMSSRFWWFSCLHTFGDYLVFTAFMLILFSRFWWFCLHTFGDYLVFALFMLILSWGILWFSCLHAFGYYLVFTPLKMIFSSFFAKCLYLHWWIRRRSITKGVRKCYLNTYYYFSCKRLLMLLSNLGNRNNAWKFRFSSDVSLFRCKVE